jgi:GAF domain-containing protein
VVDLAALQLAVAQAMLPDGAGNMGASPASTVCRRCVEALPADGAAFTAMASDQARELLCASDPVIEQVQRMQFSLGEGPALESYESGRPVLVPDLADLALARWPVLIPALAELPIGGLFTFPVTVGAIALGVVDMYRHSPGSFNAEDLATVLQIVDLAAAALLALRAGYNGDAERPGAGDVVSWLDGTGSDQQVHQATGMLIGQLEVSAEEAFARLRGYAFSHDRQIGQVAADIVARRLVLDQDPR